MAHKTNAARILDSLDIVYRLEEFEVDLDDLSASHIAELMEIRANKVYKTLVLEGNVTSYLVTVIPADAHLNLKKVAKVSGNKNCHLIPMKELRSVTGYIRGGCSPIGMKKHFPTYIQQDIVGKEEVRVSAGKRGLLMALNPADLIRVSEAIPADMVE